MLIVMFSSFVLASRSFGTLHYIFFSDYVVWISDCLAVWFYDIF